MTRIRRGFHRIGMFGLVPACATGVVLFVVAAILWASSSGPNAYAANLGAVIVIVFGAVWYAFWAGVGWVVDGFKRDDQP